MQRIYNFLRGFRDEDRGSIAVETILILPVLGFIVWLIAGPRGGSVHA